jgi:hypothetical protein
MIPSERLRRLVNRELKCAVCCCTIEFVLAQSREELVTTLSSAGETFPPSKDFRMMCHDYIRWLRKIKHLSLRDTATKCSTQ